MIRSFRDQETETVFGGRFSKRLPHGIQRVAMRKLKMINDAASLIDLKAPPNNRLEALAGDRRGEHSIRINDQWRICFAWQDGDAYRVEITDYH